jgi:hypothetical protein
MSLRLRRGVDAERAAIVFDEGELVYTTDIKELYAGDGATAGGILVSSAQIPGALIQNLDLGENDIVGTGNIDISGNVTANRLIGSVLGDLSGSVFADDSTLIINGQTSVITGDLVGSVVSDDNNNFLYADTNSTPLNIFKYSGTLTNPTDSADFAKIGIRFGSYNTAAAGYVTESLIYSYHQTAGGGLIALAPVAADNTTFFETALELDGNAQTMSVSAPNGTSFNGAITPGVYADDTARDTAITTPLAGMMVFNTTGTKFQGYTGVAWVNLN